MRSTRWWSGPGVADLVYLGFLARQTTTPQIAAIMSRSAIVGDAVEHYARLCPGRPALAYCCNIKHTEPVAQRFVEAGWRAAHVDGETPTEVRRAAVPALGRDDLDIITNCYLLIEGVDVPVLGAVLLLRPTQSVAL
jgi:DNA repair protein RadD